MEVNVATYRNRIGSFNPSRHFSYTPDITRKPTYKPSTRSIFKLRRLVIFILFMISFMSTSERVLPMKSQVFTKTMNSVNLIATATNPVSFIELGGQSSATLFPLLHLSYYDVPGVHSAATLHGVQAGHPDRGWIVAVHHLQHSVLSEI